MNNEQALRLIGNPICPYSQRAEIALIECKIEYKFDRVDFMDKPNWLKNISPLSKIPVLQVGSHIVFESSAIVEFVNEKSDQALLPEGVVPRAVIRSICAFIEYIHECARAHFLAKDKESMLNFPGNKLIIL